MHAFLKCLPYGNENRDACMQYFFERISPLCSPHPGEVKRCPKVGPTRPGCIDKNRCAKQHFLKKRVFSSILFSRHVYAADLRNMSDERSQRAL